MEPSTGATTGTTRTTRSRLSPAKLAGWAAIALGLISWLILLAGVAALQSSCSSGSADDDDSDFSDLGDNDDDAICSKLFKYQWWKTWLQLFVILAIAASLAAGWLRMHRFILLTLLAIITVLLMDDVDAYIDNNDIADSSAKKRTGTYLAGAILSLISNLILIFALGSEHDQYRAGRSVGPAVHNGTGLAPAGQSTAATMPMRDQKGPAPTTGPTTAPAAAPLGGTMV